MEVRFKTEVLHCIIIRLTVPVVRFVVRVLFWASRGYCSSKLISGWTHLTILNLVSEKLFL